MKNDTIQSRNRITTCLMVLLTFCLVLTGIFFIAPIEAEAAVGDTFTVDNIIYRVLTEEEGNYTVEVLDEALTEETAVTIPATVSNGTHTYFVTAIAAEAFWLCDDLTGITIPEGVTSIGKQAFRGCTNLTSIPLPESLETIDEQAFEYCYGLESITIPAGVSSISEYTFYKCNSLTSIIISEGVTAIDTNAFMDCTALTGITIPNSVTSVAGTAFTGCSSLTSISVGSGHTSFSSANGDLYNKEGTTLLIYAPGKQESAFEVASTVTAIGDYAFSNCTNLVSITIPSSVTSIGSNAFSYCTSLATVTIENGVSSIEDNAFRECTALESIMIPESVTSIGDLSFYKCTSLASVSLSANITSIGRSAFYQCSSLESIVIPNGVASILESAFWGCTSLATVTIPNGVTYIGHDAFRACYALETIELPDSINTIENRAFANCTSLEYIEIPNGTSGFRELFPGCSSLKSVVFPESTTFLNGGMFTNCTALESIIIKTADCSFYNNVEIPTTATVYAIGGGTIETYCTENDYGFEALVEVSWNLYGGATELELPQGYYRKGDTITITPALWESLTLDNFTLVSISCDNGDPESEPTVYTKATDSSEDITITVSDSGLNFSVKWKGDTVTVNNLIYELLSAYEGNYTAMIKGDDYSNATAPTAGSADLVIPETITFDGETYTVTEICAGSFYCTKYYKSVVIPDTVTKIGEYAFGEVYNITTLTMPSAALVEDDVFFQSSLKNLYLTGDADTLLMGRWVFQDCSDFAVYSAREGYVVTLYADEARTEKVTDLPEYLDNNSTKTLYVQWTKRLVVPEEYSTQIYEQYESFRPFDIVLNFDGGASESLTVTADMVSDFSTEEVSYSSYRTPKATITHDGDTANFEYEVVYIEPTLTTNKYDLDGDGATDEVYEITNESELKWFAMTVNDGSADLNAVLTNDISLTEDHIPIGVREITGYLREKIYAYSGMFDGRGYTVRNLYIFFEDTYSPQGYSFDNGLFGYTDGARISNVTVEGPCIQAEIGAYGYSPCAGGLIGYAKNTVINNCHVTTGDNTLSRDWNSTHIITKAQPSLGTTVRAGILFGLIKNCTVMNCSVTKQAATDYIQAWPSSDEVSISYRKDYDEQAGGIAAYASDSTIVNCYVCSINSFYGVYSGNYGGLVGHAYDLTIRNCYSSGEIIGQVAKSYTYVIDNVFSGSDVNVFSDYDAQNGTTVGNGWYEAGLSDTATFTLREGQTAPYGQTTTLAALNWGASQIDGALAWEYGESGVTFVEPTVSSIGIPTEYQNQTYAKGNSFKPFNIVVSYEQGGERTVEVTADMVTGLLTDALTEAQTATVTYGGKTATFTYTVIDGYAYRVEHYQQNLEDDAYTLVSADTETLAGVGTTNAVAKDYIGFTAQSFEQKTIAEDGTTVVKIYYTRNSYTVTYELQGGSIEGDTVQTVKFMEWISFNRTTPTKTGYTFVGYLVFWDLDDEELQVNDTPTSIDELLTDNYYSVWFNLRLEAVWAERQIESISIPAASQTQSYVVDGAFVPFNITVTYDNGETETVQATAAMVSDFSTESVVEGATATVTYTEGEVTKTATFTYSVTNGYAYTVKHYQENLEDDGYTLVEADTQTLYGVGTTEAVAKTYTGFTAQAFEQKTVDTNGSTVVEIYYDRNSYTIEVNLDGGTLSGANDITVKFGETYRLPSGTPTKAGYTFAGWKIYIDGEVYINASVGSSWLSVGIPMDKAPEDTIEARVTWNEREISDMVLNVTNTTYEVGDEFRPFNMTVAYDNGEQETVQVTAEMLTDFSTATARDQMAATITYKGATKLMTYKVVEKTNTVSFNIGGGTGTAPQSMDATVGASVTLPSADGLTKTGYTFGGWSDGTNTYEAGASYTPSEDISLTAVWKLKAPTITIEGVEPLEGDNKAEYVLEFTYDGNAHNVTLHASHELGDAVTYEYYVIKYTADSANPDMDSLPPWALITNTTQSFTNVSDSNYYLCVVKTTLDDETTAAYTIIKVDISKADQTITLSEDEFTYSEGLTIDFADYVGGTGDGTLSFEVSNQSGVTFDFANGVISNITKAGGTFTLTVTKAATDNYNSATQTFTVELNKATQTLSVSGTPSVPNWKEAFTVSVSGNKGALSYAITSGNASVDTNGVITANGAGQVRYSVTAAATNLYEAVTVERTVTFGKAAGNLAPDYVLPTGLTVCLGKSTNDITLPGGWSFETTTTFNSVGAKNVTAKFTPSDTANYSVYTISLTITVDGHKGGTAASCTTDQVCTECGEILVEALGHNYNEQVDNTVRTTAANCQECNTYWYDCSRCDASAKNDANATDKWYTSNEAGEHNMSSDWTSENGQHFHKCTVNGCTHTDTKVNCSGGMATCVSPAICSVCQNPYGSVTAHHFYDTSEWGYKDTDGHAHVCEYCGVHDTVVGHTPNVDAATEDVAKYCTVCDFVIEQQLDHVHSEGTEWKYNSEYHWHDCVGNDGQVYSKAEHTYDNACDTTCNVCNATRTITHDYSKLEKNDTEHWYVCSVCGSEKANSRVAHSGGTNDCQTKAECATCGQTYGEFGNHDYDTTVWVSVDDLNHAHKCTLCNAYTDATDHYSADEATCTGEQLCDSCNYKMADALGHSYTKKIENPAYLKAEGENCQSHHAYYYACVRCDASSKNDTNESYEGSAVGAHKMSATWTTENDPETGAGWHYHECTVSGCDYKEDEGDCDGGTATCLAKAVCSTCHQAYGKLADHTFGTTWEYKDASGHAHVCTVSGCNEHDEIKDHTPNIPAATEQSAQYCTACQYQMAAQLNHTHIPATEWTSNATHHWKACGGCDEHLEEAPHSYDPNNACDTTCEVCNAVREVSHDFTGEWEKDASGHWHVCTKNGCSVTDTKQNHVSAGAATETDPEVCSICGWQIAPALGHTTHTPEAEWQKNETHHWHECTGCDGQELDKAAHNDGNNDGSCDACGYAMSVTPPPHTHVFGTDWVTDEGNHWKECECEEKSELGAHVDSDSNGACDACGYAMSVTPPPHTHSYGTTWVTDANNHWKECECEEKSEVGAHVDNNGDNRCDTCDYAMPAHDPDTPDDPNNTPEDPSGDDEGGLGTGAIIAIVAASVVALGGGGFALYWFVIRKKKI